MPCKLFVGGISAQTTTEALRGHFSRYGRLIDAVVMSKNGRPRGFGFVTYDAPGPAVMALAEAQWLDGRLVDVKRAVPGERTQERTSNKIFVGGLPQDVTTDDLKGYFGTYGAVADAVVMVDRRTNRSRGFGFVRFASGAQGTAASEAVLIDFASHRLGGKWVEVKRATPAALLQELSPCGSIGPDSGGSSPASQLAYIQEQCGMYLMDPSGWDLLAGANSPTGGAAAVRGHARGRRGRRRKQRSGSSEDFFDLDGSGDECDDGLSSPYDLTDTGSPLLSAMAAPPGLQSGAGGAVAFVPSDAASAAAASAAAVAAWGGLSPLSPACGLGGLGGSSDHTAEGREVLGSDLRMCSEVFDHGAGGNSRRRPMGNPLGLSSGGAFGGGSSENDPSRANAAAPALPPSLRQSPGSPMKVACLEKPDSHGEWSEAFTRDDFLSLEVRPWMAAW